MIIPCGQISYLERSLNGKYDSMSLNTNASHQALIFIPDISGYTKFVSSTEIQHAKHIVEELLEAILSANEIGLELSEIEGDALLLYRKGKAPNCQELLAQIQKMYISFHTHLKKYETQRICSCGACCSANNLELKFIAHYGEMAETVINNRPGLFGKAVIAAHRLLKNKINSNEYTLFSNELMSACPTWSKMTEVIWGETFQLEEEYDFGTARYSYAELKNLAKLVPEPKPEDLGIPGATQNVLEMEGVIESPLDVTFNVISDYYFRSEFLEWQFGEDNQNHKIFQNGSMHKCIVNEKGSGSTFVAHDYSFDQNKVTFVESDHKDGVSLVWTLLAIEKGITRVRITIIVKPNFLKVFMFNLFMKKKIAKDMQKSWINLNEYCKKIILEKKQHPHRIILPEKVFEANKEK